MATSSSLKLLDAPTGGALPPMSVREMLLVRDMARLAITVDRAPYFFWVQVERVDLLPDGPRYVGKAIATTPDGVMGSGELFSFRPINVFAIQSRPKSENPFGTNPVDARPIDASYTTPGPTAEPGPAPSPAVAPAPKRSGGWGKGIVLGLAAVGTAFVLFGRKPRNRR